MLGLFAVAALVLAAWVWQQLRRDHPLVALRELRHRAVLSADVAAMLLGLAMYLFLSLLTAFVQTPPSAGYGFGGDDARGGPGLLPFSILSLLGEPHDRAR